MSIKKAYKIRLYPNKQQAQTLLQTAGACRWVYNHFLDARKENDVGFAEASRSLTKLRKEYDWLKDANRNAMDQALIDLDSSFSRFFTLGHGHPRFKSRKYSKVAFRKSKGWSIKEGKLYVFRTVGVKYRGTLPSDGSKVSRLSILMTRTGKWYASILAEVDAPEKVLSGSIGIDLGLTDLAITSDGIKFNNARFERTQADKMKRLQQSLSRKKKGSKRHQIVKAAITRLHEKISNQRMNYLHQVSSAITSKNHALIAVEDLAVGNMQKNRKLARSIQDVSWGELLRQIEYKQIWRGGELFKVDRFFPSSKTCSSCEYVVNDLPLSVRMWSCMNCGVSHDRDINAARNILKQAERRLGVEEQQPVKREHAIA